MIGQRVICRRRRGGGRTFHACAVARSLHRRYDSLFTGRVPSTPMLLVRRLTEQAVTPGTLDTAFSTRALHAAQLMPVT